MAEAGGFVAPILPGRDPLTDGEVIAGNAEIFEKFATVIRTRSPAGQPDHRLKHGPSQPP